jgi:hypothetical protein
MSVSVESYRSMHTVGVKERLQIKSFASSNDMHTFLCKGDNALRWRQSAKDLKPGVYAYAGGKWHNVKHLDACMLAHI